MVSRIAYIILIGYSVQGLCPDGWTQFHGSCYYLFEDKEEWPQAMFLCQGHHAHLAIIESAQENEFLENMVRTKQVHQSNVWIGGNDQMTEGVWRWTTDERVTFTDWRHGQPDNYHGDQNCLAIVPDFGYKWDDSHCNNRFFYICETRYDYAT